MGRAQGSNGYSNGYPLRCTDLSSSERSNISLFNDSTIQLLFLQLPSANLSREIPREIGELSSLQSLYLGINSLKGNIPLELGYNSSLSDVDLGGNSFNGFLPPSIWNLCDRLVSLWLHRNNLFGSLPEPALPNSTCRNLQVLDFGNNKFSGEFPEFIIRFNGLNELDLSNNLFARFIPDSLTRLNLERLNLAYNNFTGVLPVFGESKFGMDAFEGNNPGLCGSSLRNCRKNFGLSSGTIAGIVIGLMTGTVILASVLIGHVQGKKKKNKRGDEDDIEEGEEEEEENEGGGCDNGVAVGGIIRTQMC